MVRAYAILYSEILTSAGMLLAAVLIVVIGNIKYLMPVNWTSYTTSRRIHEQPLCMWKRMQTQPREVGESPESYKTDQLKQGPTEGRRLFVTVNKECVQKKPQMP